MKDLASFQQSLVQTGYANPNGQVPVKKQQDNTDYASLFNQSAQQQQVAQSPQSPSQNQGFSWGEHYKKLAAPSLKAAGAVGNFMTSSEQKLGRIIGDTLAANTGAQDIVNQNTINEGNMLRRVQQQITENKAQGKDTSHLEWVLASAIGKQQSPEQQMEQIAPGSQATNEEALGAIGGTALDVLTAGTYGAAATPVVRGAQAMERGARGAGEIIKQGFKQGLKAAPVGAAYGVTSAMQDNATAGEAAFSGVAGATIAGAIPVAAGLGSAVTQKIKPTVQRALVDYEGQVGNMFGRTQTSRKLLAKSEAIDKSPVDLLVSKAKHGDIVPISVQERGGTKVWDTKEGVQKLWDDVTDLREQFYKPMLKESPERIPLDTIASRAKARIRASMGGSPDYQSAINKIDDTFKALKSAPDYQSGSLRLDQVDDLKSDRWNASRGLFAKTRPEFESSVDYQIAEAAKEIIEQRMPDDAAIGAFNKFIGQHLQTIEQLSKIDESIVKDGKIGKHFMRTVGAIVGGTQGGYAGAAGGAMVGDNLSGTLGEFSANNPYVMRALEGIDKKNPALVQQLEDFVPKFLQENKGKVKVPSKVSKFGVTDLSGGKPLSLKTEKTKLGVTVGEKPVAKGSGGLLNPPASAMAMAPMAMQADSDEENDSTGALLSAGMLLAGKMTPAKRAQLNSHYKTLEKLWNRAPANSATRKQIERALGQIVSKLGK